MTFILKYSKIIGWIANIFTVIGVALTSWNIFPLNVWILSFASLVWILSGIAWRKPELWTLNILLFTLYFYGALNAS